MRVSHRWRWSSQGQADGGHRDTSHVLPQGPAPTHTHTRWSCATFNARLFFHCDSRGDQARTPHGGKPEWVPTQMSPLTHRESPTCGSAEPGASQGSSKGSVSSPRLPGC